MSSKKEEKESSKPVGGLVFFSSLLVLSFLGLFNLWQLLRLIEGSSVARVFTFVGSSGVGLALSLFILPPRFHVFIHELKHSIVSNLAGNRAKGMKVDDESGHFKFEYTKKTAAYNAFIALAPYWFPLFTIVVGPISFIFIPAHSLWLVAIIGLCYGIDFRMNMRDISPYQTDFSGIRGGFICGLLYVVAMNLTLLTFVLAWVLQGAAGLLALPMGLWHTLKVFTFYLRGLPLDSSLN